MSREEKIKEMVERMGVLMESKGDFSPIAGRVFAYLLLADPPYKDFYEIQEFMGASKSSISNAIKLLQSRGMISYITFTGDRRRYFKVDFNRWIDDIRGVTEYIQRFNKELQNVRTFRKEEQADPEFLDGLCKVIRFQGDVLEAVKECFAKWGEEEEE